MGCRGCLPCGAPSEIIASVKATSDCQLHGKRKHEETGRCLNNKTSTKGQQFDFATQEIITIP